MKKLFAPFVAFFGLMMGLLTSAHAELPPGVATGLAQVQTDAGELRDIVIPIVVAILGMTLVIKLIKRFGSKL